MSERPIRDEQVVSIAKAPAPDLDGRAPRPRAVRLRGSVVRAVGGGGGLLLAGALTWAFVVQPEMRDAARDRALEAREEPARRNVRPSEAVSSQPATYDRLPPPRGEGRAEEEKERSEELAPPSGGYRSTGGGRVAPTPRSSGADAARLAASSPLVFGGGVQPVRLEAADPRTVGPMEPGPARARPDGYGRHGLSAPLSPYELKAGAILPAVLLTGVDTSRPGPVVAAVTQNLYDSVTGRHLLAPQGSRLLGRHEGESAYGDRRAFLVWERLILPNGRSLMLEAEPGVDAAGAVGVQGRVDRRLGALAIGTLFAGAVTTLGQMARDESGRGGEGFFGDAGDAAAIEGARVGGRLIDRELEVRPVVRVPAGARVQVLVTRDLVLEPYR